MRNKLTSQNWKEEFEKRFINSEKYPLKPSALTTMWGANIIDFIQSLIDAVREEEREKIRLNFDKKRAKEICDQLERYTGKRDCSMCGYNPERQRDLIDKSLTEEDGKGVNK